MGIHNSLVNGKVNHCTHLLLVLLLPPWLVNDPSISRSNLATANMKVQHFALIPLLLISYVMGEGQITFHDSLRDTDG
jgi:hypothetical protein